MEQNIFNFLILVCILYILYYLLNNKLDNFENDTNKECSDKAINDSYTNYIFGTPLSKLKKILNPTP